MKTIVCSEAELEAAIRKAIRQEIASAPTPPPAKTASGPLLSVDELCRELDVTRQTVSGWVKSGRIKAQRLGRRLYFNRADLQPDTPTKRKGGRR